MEPNELKTPVYESKRAVVQRLAEIARSEENVDKSEVDLLKQVFYKLHLAELEQARKQYEETGADAATFITPVDEDEIAFKAQLNLIKERRSVLLKQQEQQREENYARKMVIIERLKALLSAPDEANQAYSEVRDMQQQWKEIGAVPPEKATDLWKLYQLLIEQYYDIVKINNELREYDFKKNLEVKLRLCEEAEKLATSEDVIAAARQLQVLHQEYRDCGPVSKEQRELVWNRFKEASTLVNKRHQAHFEQIKAKEEDNLAQKVVLCEQLEQMNLQEATTVNQWNKLSQQVLDIQAKWKEIGFAPQKYNVKIFERFRKACDRFFSEKSEFFKNLKTVRLDNLKKKVLLCEQVEQLCETSDWKTATEKLALLQKEWKEIGSVAKKDSDEVWKRFTAACDAFFERRSQISNAHRAEEQANLQKKRAIIDRMRTLTEKTDEGVKDLVRELINEWNEVGHVPFKQKDKIYEEFHALVDEAKKNVRLADHQKRLNRYKERIKEKGVGERERLMRQYEAIRSELKTYENNVGFLTLSSKKGNGLLNEINRKMETLKEDLELVSQKIKALANSK